ncbi:hypothetical protein SO802_022444 [Lithocarpus litseifolius]|uniref:Uncharacterized protein n=1 Tax=Lithocarpus litseifolius TaxID=425828 RepID=A0AAW2CJR3_9ROSI
MCSVFSTFLIHGGIVVSATQKGSSPKGKQPVHFDTSTGKKRKAINAIMEMELSKKKCSDKDTDSRKIVESPDLFSMSKAVEILILYFLLHVCLPLLDLMG